MQRSIALAILLIASPLFGQTWHGSDAQPLATGKLVSTNGDSAVIQKADKTTANIKLANLSLADRAAILANSKSEFQQPTRGWTSASGTYHVDAKAISVADESIGLVTSDNRTINVPLAKLSSDDRAYVDRLQKFLAPKVEDDPFAGDQQPTKPNALMDSAASTVTAAKASTVTAAKPLSPPSAVDRNPNGETPTGQTATGIPEFTGPRGGTYHYSASGKKVYDKKK